MNFVKGRFSLYTYSLSTNINDINITNGVVNNNNVINLIPLAAVTVASTTTITTLSRTITMALGTAMWTATTIAATTSTTSTTPASTTAATAKQQL